MKCIFALWAKEEQSRRNQDPVGLAPASGSSALHAAQRTGQVWPHVCIVASFSHYTKS